MERGPNEVFAAAAAACSAKIFYDWPSHLKKKRVEYVWPVVEAMGAVVGRQFIEWT